MTEREATSAQARTASVGRWLCLTGALIGAVGLLDAIGRLSLLGALVPAEPSMTANTGLALLLLGGAGVLRDQQDDAGAIGKTLARLATLVVLAIGVVTLAEHAFDTNLHIDQVIVRSSDPIVHPGRPAPATALALMCLAGALLVFDFRIDARARPSEWLILAGGLIALTVLLGFVFGAELRHRLGRAPLIGAAFPTAIALLLMSVGLLFERPRAGLMCVATSPGPGGMQFRRLVLPAFLVPVVVGILVALPLRAVATEALVVALAVLAAAMGVMGLLVLIGLAMSLNRTYQALEASRAGAQTLVEQAPDAVFIADIAGRYTDVNSAGCRMLGYTRDEVLTMTIADVLAPEDLGRLTQQRERLLGGASQVGEWTLRHKEGGRIPVEISAKIFPDGRWQALVRDISERKRLEGQLRAAEGEQKFLADFGSALMSTIDVRETVEVIATHIARELADVCVIETVEEGGQQPHRMVTYRDPSAAIDPELEQMKIDRSRHIGTAVIEWKQPLLIHDVTPAHLDGIAQSDEHRRLLREIGPRSLMALPLLAHGGVFGSLLVISTNAERRYTERDLSVAQKVASRAALAIEKARLYRIAQEAIRLREDVLSIVAHDLRNPLGTILLQAAMLRRGGGAHGDPPRKPADVIERSAVRMNHLIQDLLDVARMEGGRLSITQTRVPAGLVISDAVQAQEPRAASASLDLRLEAESQLPELWADRDRLLQIFENLIGNAIKFTKAGGCITVGAARADEHVLFWVADTGYGIAADDLPHVFERLWQASKTGQHGAGLGLPIVKGIVEAHGGRVWVESRLGEGSIFFFTIPTVHTAEAWRSQQPQAYG